MHQQDVKRRLSHIYDHVARNEVYRGYRSIPVALTGVIAILAAGLQSTVLTAAVPGTFVLYWASVAAISMSVAGVPVYLRYRRADTRIERRRTRKTVGQLVPSILAGAMLTGCITYAAPPSIPLLPGLWALLFGLGIHSSRPYLPAATAWVAYLYCGAGLLLILMAPALELSPWGMGLTFGFGQFLSAIVLYRHSELESNEHA